MRIDVHESKDLLVSHGKEAEETLRGALLDHKRAVRSLPGKRAGWS
ncbi:MAG: hypothetical protein ACRDSJ_04385 [Rubrobacteraceae bacterium]